MPIMRVRGVTTSAQSVANTLAPHNPFFARRKPKPYQASIAHFNGGDLPNSMLSMCLIAAAIA